VKPFADPFYQNIPASRLNRSRSGSIPAVLNRKEVMRCWAPDVNEDPLALRDRAILEPFYATGLRERPGLDVLRCTRTLTRCIAVKGEWVVLICCVAGM
jgi:site-specific recombinase XerD